MTKYDIVMKIKLCDRHKQEYDQKVTFKLSKGGYGIAPSALVGLWTKTSECTDCEWQTTFPTLNTEGKSA